MNEEILKQAVNLFDSADKWNAFCELINKNGAIQNRWWKQLQLEVFNREMKNGESDWTIDIWNNWDIRWCPKNESNKGIVIHFWGDVFRVFYNYGNLDLDKVNLLLEDPKFDIIKNCFERIDGSNFETLAWEYRNFSFGTIHDGRFPDSRTLSWYAGNRTQQFADQLIAKVRKFQTPEITALFREINHLCKK